MHDPARRSLARLLLLGAVCASPRPAVAAADTVPLAIRGYDPVAYFTLGTPVRGSPRFELEWDEQRYWFSRAAHRALFEADPVRYAPRFANVCAMALARGEIVEADPEYWLISEGRLYLFALPVGPERFRRDVAGNVIRAKQHEARTLQR